MDKIFDKQEIIDYLNNKIDILFDRLKENRKKVSEVSFRAIAIRLLSQQIDLITSYPEEIIMNELELRMLIADIYEQAEELDDAAFSINYEEVFICRLD